uniref:Uncharacterized protein n=1 Tax=Cacopsylla melanoneura TaxID=428564 RepID=A0A8D8UUU1_9HEMI
MSKMSYFLYCVKLHQTYINVVSNEEKILTTSSIFIIMKILESVSRVISRPDDCAKKPGCSVCKAPSTCATDEVPARCYGTGAAKPMVWKKSYFAPCSWS